MRSSAGRQRLAGLGPPSSTINSSGIILMQLLRDREPTRARPSPAVGLENLVLERRGCCLGCHRFLSFALLRRGAPRVAEELVNRPLVVCVLAILERGDAAVAGDEEVGG